MLISILIPTCSRPELLRRCLNKLLPQRSALASGVDCEILIGNDGNSIPELIAEFASIATEVAGPKRGPAANRNNLASNAKGDLLVFLDDDCIPHEGLISAYSIAAESHPEYEVFEGRILAPRKPRFADEECPINENGGFMWSANFAIRRGCFTSIGGFDEDFPFAAMEDVDLNCRILESGRQILWMPNATVSHDWERRTGGTRLLKQSFSIATFALKHPSWLPRVRRNYDVKASLRLIKQRIFQRGVLQPVSSYRHIFEVLQFMNHMRQTLQDPVRIAEERSRLATQLNLKVKAL
jgi:GT2 family glycosyltransferase